MKYLPKLHLLLFVLAWIFAATWGTAGVLAVGAVLAAVQLLVWRLDLAQFGDHRRTWTLLPKGVGRGPVPSYDEVRHAIAMGGHSRREYDFNLRRRLERIASSRLADTAGVDLHTQPDAAREVLGPETWSLVDPAVPISSDRTGGGVSPAALTRAVDRLEAL
ncbi:MAG: hypothetical protein ACRDO1_12310 [Nocardioidaceae bacterium]